MKIKTFCLSHLALISNTVLAATCAVWMAAVPGWSATDGEELARRQCRSVHLWYEGPRARIFYNEVTVEKSAVGTYFCVCGFNQGYFGIQERDRDKVVIFSVWDPGEQNNPNSVPEERRVKVLYEGEDVRVGRFGNEGTGAQSFFKYDWKPGATYRFMVEASVQEDKTTFAAYFYLNDAKRWKHLVSFQTLSGGKQLGGYYSFIEDFKRNYASARVQRRANFHNGWLLTQSAEWRALTNATFTADQTPSAHINALGTTNGFVLVTGGDTSMTTKLQTRLTAPRDAAVAPPRWLVEFIKQPDQ